VAGLRVIAGACACDPDQGGHRAPVIRMAGHARGDGIWPLCREHDARHNIRSYA
jgi:hypothetical protein